MTHEALANPGWQRAGAAPAQPGRDGGGRDCGRHGHRGGGRRVRRLGCRGGVVCPYGQWSRSHPGRATLVRHVLLQATAASPTITASTAPLAPAPRPLGVGYPAPPRPLVSVCALAPSRVARQAPALPATVAVATIAVAAQHDLHAATRAQEQAPWSIHAHPGREPKLQCWTDASQRCHTDAAPPSSARCRARYGRSSFPARETVAAPTFFGMSAVVSRAPPRTAGAPPKSQPHPDSASAAFALRPRHRLRLPGRPAGRPGRRNPSNSPIDQLNIKSAALPANRRGS